MDYILLVLVVILFTNKQYNDLCKKHIYNKNDIECKEKNFNDNYKKTQYYSDLRLKQNINNSNCGNKNIKNIDENNVRNNNPKQLDNIMIYNRPNDNERYSLVDICEENKEIHEEHESYKENIIETINDKLVDNIVEETVVNNKDIVHKENKDNKRIIKEDSDSKKNNGFNKLKNKYRGVNVSVVISGVGVLEGEIVFDFPNIIALKNKDNIIVFIDESTVLSIF